MISRFICFILLAFSINSAQAYNACAGMFVMHPEPVASKSVSLGELHPKFYSRIQRWNKILGDLRVDGLFLDLSSDPITKSYYSLLDRKIHVGTRLLGRDPMAREKVMAHEFGHAVFSEHFAFLWRGDVIRVKDLAQRTKKFMLERKSDPRVILLLKQAQSMNEHIELVKPPGLPGLANKVMHGLGLRTTALEAEGNPSEQYAYVKDMLIAYEELFADSLPALLWHDSRTITEAVEDPYQPFYTGESRSFDLYRKENDVAPDPRDFNLVRFKDWHHEKADKYTLFDPARGVLWKLFMENLKTEEIPLFLLTYMEAASAHITRRLERGEDIRVSKQESNPTLINQEFVQIFVDTAKATGLPLRKNPDTP